MPASFRAVKRSMIRPAVGLLISFTLSSGFVEWTLTYRGLTRRFNIRWNSSSDTLVKVT